MRTSHALSLTGLLLGAVLGLSAPAAHAVTSFFGCSFECLQAYDQCVLDRGLKAGCGREFKACTARCP